LDLLKLGRPHWPQSSVRGGLTYRNARRRPAAMMRERVGAEMSASYFVEPIGPETTDRAYPLAQAILPALSKHEWWQFCRSPEFAGGRTPTVGEREEVVVARNPKGYVKGLCIYAIREHATYGRLVDVPFFIASSGGQGGDIRCRSRSLPPLRAISAGHSDSPPSISQSRPSVRAE
jgi:hypothetical protein